MVSADAEMCTNNFSRPHGRFAYAVVSLHQGFCYFICCGAPVSVALLLWLTALLFVALEALRAAERGAAGPADCCSRFRLEELTDRSELSFRRFAGLMFTLLFAAIEVYLVSTK